jgi:hypothetical protein
MPFGLWSPIMGSRYVLLIVYFPNNNNCWAARIPLDQGYSFLDSCVEPLEFVIRNHPHLPVLVSTDTLTSTVKLQSELRICYWTG